MPRRLLRYLVLLVAALLLAMPLVLYQLGLSGVQGVPGKPRVLASHERQMLVWTRAQGKDMPRMDSLNPYSFAFGLLSGKPNDPGLVVASWVARDYLLENGRYGGMSWWHLSGAALTIWLSRNWSAEELLTKVLESPRASQLNNPGVPDATARHAQ